MEITLWHLFELTSDTFLFKVVTLRIYRWPNNWCKNWFNFACLACVGAGTLWELVLDTLGCSPAISRSANQLNYHQNTEHKEWKRAPSQPQTEPNQSNILITLRLPKCESSDRSEIFNWTTFSAQLQIVALWSTHSAFDELQQQRFLMQIDTHRHEALQPRINGFCRVFVRWRGRTDLALLESERQSLCCRQNIIGRLVCIWVAWKQ